MPTKQQRLLGIYVMHGVTIWRTLLFSHSVNLRLFKSHGKDPEDQTLLYLFQSIGLSVHQFCSYENVGKWSIIERLEKWCFPQNSRWHHLSSRFWSKPTTDRTPYLIGERHACRLKQWAVARPPLIQYQNKLPQDIGRRHGWSDSGPLPTPLWPIMTGRQSTRHISFPSCKSSAVCK